ncbi:MAG: translocation/assembly module TamB domain-containing protein [Tannerella sp.]|jgi:hypothetical protein|nr:translocation/assembly module TamB domain-containing protein [Tannerella sp.]
MNKRVKKRIKIIGWVCLIPVMLICVVTALLYIPSVQRLAVKQASQMISASSGLQVEAGSVRLTFPLHLTLCDVSVISPAQTPDTLFFIRRAKLHVRPRPLLGKEISIDGFQLEDVRLSLMSGVEGVEITGRIGRLTTSGDRIFPEGEEIRLSRLTLSDAAVTLRIDSVAPSDTSRTENHWIIGLDDIRLQRVSVALLMPSGAERFASGVEQLVLTDGRVDFGAEQYSAAHIRLSDATVSYDLGDRPAGKGFDPSHIALSEIQVGLDSLFYRGKELRACLQTFSAQEQSGLAVTSMNGTIAMDTATLHIPRWSLCTPYSTVSMHAELPLSSAPAEMSRRIFRAQLEASLDGRDMLTLLGEDARSIERYCPDTLLTLSGLLEGTTERMYLRRLQGELPGIFRMEADGFVDQIANRALRAGQLHLTASTLSGKTSPPGLSAAPFALPADLHADLQAALTKEIFRADLSLTGQQGNASLSGHYDTKRKAYAVALSVDGLEPGRFMPGDSTMRLTASLRAEGKGTDFFADSTRAQIEGVLTEMRYRNITFSGLSVDGTLKDHRLQASLESEYPYAKGTVTLNGEVRREKCTGLLIVDMDSLDLYELRMTDQPFAHSFRLFAELETNGLKHHRVDVTLGNWEMDMGMQKINPETVTLHAHGDEDTTRLSFHAGDLGITLAGNTDLETTLRKLNAVPVGFMQQIREDSLVRLQPLRALLPDVSLQITAGRDNPVYHYLQEKSIFFDRFTLDASVSPAKGVRMDALLLSFIQDTMKIDTIRMAVRQDTTGIHCLGEVIKNKFRRQEPFTAGWNGDLQDGKAGLEMYYRNGRDETGLYADLRATQQPDGIRIRLLPEVVIAFLPFSVNPDNQVFVKSAKDISANLRLDGEKDASIRLYSQEEEATMTELSLEISRINLAHVTRGFGDRMPPLQGLADVSLRYVPMNNTYMMVMEAGVDNLIYRNGSVGELSLSGIYLPVDRGEHQIDMHLFHDRKEISTLSALYEPAQQGRLTGAVEMNRCPLAMFNPFFEGTAQLNGALQGRMSIEGTEQNPLLNGYLQMDTAAVYIAAAGARLRFDEQKVEIKDSRVQFNNYHIHAAGDNPFVIDGAIDIHNPVRGKADLKLTANNMQLLDTRKTVESLVYGKLSVDLNSTLSGALNSLTMRGYLHLSGNTNLAYVMKDSPLTVRDRMADLVTFSYFHDTIPRRTRRSYAGMPHESAPAYGGLDMQLTVRVDPTVKLRIDLDDASSNRIELDGGGALSLQYTRQGDLLLSGRYTLSGGLVKYNMPVIANKTLTVKENSYIEWTGDPMDPYLNLKATERIRSSVGTGGTPHIVNFDAGIEVKQRLANLSLQFTLDALDDATVQNQLIAMGPEERGKQAVSLLLTGMYLADDGSGKKKIDMGTALNSFLQSEINHITGSLLKDVDFNFIMDSYDGAEAGSGRRTDYAFRFSKRFYNERINVILGGLVSTGAAADQKNTFINDASVEYRLDAGGSRYAKLFYNRQYESLLEGEITKYGTGIVFRKKMRHLYDLFLFRKQRLAPVTEKEKKENEKNEP